jgi:hypothetical protein
MNVQLLGLLAVVTPVVAVLGSLMYLAQRDKSARDSAQKLIANAGHHKTDSAGSGEVLFRKARLPGYLLLLLFLCVFGIAAYSLIYNWGSLHTAARPLTGFSASMGILISLLPLAMAIRELRYTVRVSEDELVISDLTTKSVPLQDISEVTIGVSKLSSFCQIRPMTGEEYLQVGSDLKNFPEFVSLLSERVNKSKS